MTVKQLFETYVYAQTLSSVDLSPFVIHAISWPDTQMRKPIAKGEAY
ncbi:MAG: hypothetical protein M3Q94_14050 [Pseudomonadota bacterium]|nr:hypothetical protein [Pseudomonadota bacterium]